MYVNGIQCDVCTKIYDMNVHHEPLPKDWMALRKDEEILLHFCSIGCLSAWALKQKMEERENMSSNIFDNMGKFIDVPDTGGPVVALSHEEFERRFGSSQ